MLVSSLQLTNFRNYQQANVAFVPGINLLHGANGQGKTNLAEAIFYLSGFGSHRVSKAEFLIKAGETSAVIRAELINGGRRQTVAVQINRSASNLVTIGGNNARMRDLVNLFSCVLFSPEDLDLVRGDPNRRRDYIDQLLCQLKPRMLGVFSDYERTLKQRNTLLKTFFGQADPAKMELLDVWTGRLAELGEQICRERVRVLETLRISHFYGVIAGDNQLVEVSYSPPPNLYQTLTDLFRKEVERGITLAGPHRDDLEISLNGLSARSQSSQGEAWSVAIALRLAAAAAIRENISDPVIILDDVFAELDMSRRQRLAEAIMNYEQVIVTMADHYELAAAAKISICGGEII